MKPRIAADYRSLFWVLVLCPLPVIAAYVWPSLALGLLPLAAGLTYTVGTIAHNHNHFPIFSGRRSNAAFGAWLSFFYGAPIVFWIPTHNRNHHRHLNGPGDDTRTSRFSEHDSLVVALLYPLRSTRVQLPVIRRFIAAARRQNPALFRQILLQIGALAGGHALALGLSFWLHGPWLGATTYALSLGLPALFGPWAMMFTNYLQHVGCDPSSADAHSRNFTHRALNWLTFNGGYHTVHHEHAATHWSRYPELHRRRQAAIGADLVESTLIGYCCRRYLPFRQRPASPLPQIEPNS
jgi:fatty acid desaturase